VFSETVVAGEKKNTVPNRARPDNKIGEWERVFENTRNSTPGALGQTRAPGTKNKKVKRQSFGGGWDPEKDRYYPEGLKNGEGGKKKRRTRASQKKTGDQKKKKKPEEKIKAGRAKEK